MALLDTKDYAPASSCPIDLVLAYPFLPSHNLLICYKFMVYVNLELYLKNCRPIHCFMQTNVTLLDKENLKYLIKTMI